MRSDSFTYQSIRPDQIPNEAIYRRGCIVRSEVSVAICIVWRDELITARLFAEQFVHE
jgi:hypothetical protein